MYFPLPILGFMFHCTNSWQSEFYTPKSGRGEKRSKIQYLLNVIIFISNLNSDLLCIFKS